MGQRVPRFLVHLRYDEDADAFFILSAIKGNLTESPTVSKQSASRRNENPLIAKRFRQPAKTCDSLFIEGDAQIVDLSKMGVKYTGCTSLD
jgi:hypothetical protein